jgi:hypothetical protein
MKAVTLVALFFALCGIVPQAIGQDTWAEHLNYPAGARVVILHAEDLGIAYECNRPAQEFLVNGPLSTASFLATGPWFAEIAKWSKSHPDVDLGISLSFVSPSAAIKWGSVAPRHETPTLLTVDGYFPESVAQFHVRADHEDVRREAEAQIRRAREMGVQPSHIHPHLGAMMARPDLLRVYLDLAVEHWIPAVMVEFTPELVAKFRDAGYPLDEEMLEMIAAYPLPKVDDLKHIPTADSYEEKRQQFFTTIEELKPGITEIFLRASDESPGMQRASKSWQNRAWEAQLLADPEVREFLQKQNIVMTNWREIMARFEQRQEPTPE